METEKLYYQDSFIQSFPAQVLSCQAAGEVWKVVLDQTAFFPEGGGQPADLGILGAVRVLDVHEKDGVVVHSCSGPLAEGETVMGKIDWNRRFDHMQQHSGEHVLSGILCGDYHCSNVGFHLGAETVTIDYNADISWEQALAAEAKANRIIWENREVEITYPSPAELESLEYRSKKALTGQVRIVTFPGADCCACCGTHVTATGQVGLVKILSCQKFREGVRMEILCGERAFRYLAEVYSQARDIAQGLSAKPAEITAAVERVKEELATLKIRTAHLEEQVFADIARENAGKGNVLLFQEPLRPDSVRRLSDAVAKACGGLSAVFAGEGDHFAYALVRADAADISPLVKALNAALRGRGGGRNGFAQGSVQASQKEIEGFFQAQKEAL